MSPSPPFPPGQSPFHVKGSTYVGIRQHIDEQLPGGLEALLARLPDDLHRSFATQVFLPVAWYDALPIAPLTRVMAELEGRDYAESVKARASAVARRDMTGLYRLLLRVVSPDQVLERLQRALLRYFDFGQLDILASQKGRAESRLSGIPEPLSPWFSPMVVGYATEVLRAGGASSPRVWVDVPAPDGERSGVALVSLRGHFSWG